MIKAGKQMKQSKPVRKATKAVVKVATKTTAPVRVAPKKSHKSKAEQEQVRLRQEARKANALAIIASEEAFLGRESGYRPEYIQELLDYFNVPSVIEVEKTITMPSGNTETVTVKTPQSLPTLAGFCCALDIHRETLLNWGKQSPAFFDALMRVKEHQERILVENGLMGGYEKTFAIFVAKNLTSLKDKQEIDLDANVNVVMDVESLDSLYGNAREKARLRAEEMAERATLLRPQ